MKNKLNDELIGKILETVNEHLGIHQNELQKKLGVLSNAGFAETLQELIDRRIIVYPKGSKKKNLYLNGCEDSEFYDKSVKELITKLQNQLEKIENNIQRYDQSLKEYSTKILYNIKLDLNKLIKTLDSEDDKTSEDQYQNYYVNDLIKKYATSNIKELKTYIPIAKNSNEKIKELRKSYEEKLPMVKQTNKNVSARAKELIKIMDNIEKQKIKLQTALEDLKNTKQYEQTKIVKETITNTNGSTKERDLLRITSKMINKFGTNEPYMQQDMIKINKYFLNKLEPISVKHLTKKLLATKKFSNEDIEDTIRLLEQDFDFGVRVENGMIYSYV